MCGVFYAVPQGYRLPFSGAAGARQRGCWVCRDVVCNVSELKKRVVSLFGSRACPRRKKAGCAYSAGCSPSYAPVKRRTCGGCWALSQAVSVCARLPLIASTAPSAMSRPPIQIQLM